MNFFTLFLESRVTCEHDQIKAGVEGVISGSLEAGRNNTSNCTLELTNIPQYTLVEFVVNYYKQPEDCHCNQAIYLSCSRTLIRTSGSNTLFCDKPSDPFYLYKNSGDNIFISLSGIDLHKDYAVNITYRGECYNTYKSTLSITDVS